jgi:hypothetical protein
MMDANWLAGQAELTRVELGKAILNRNHWDRLREELRLYEFLQARTTSADFRSLREELERIVEGGLRVPTLSNPRRTAADCLQRWSPVLASPGDAPAPAEADPQ